MIPLPQHRRRLVAEEVLPLQLQHWLPEALPQQSKAEEEPWRRRQPAEAYHRPPPPPLLPCRPGFALRRRSPCPSRRCPCRPLAVAAAVMAGLVLTPLLCRRPCRQLAEVAAVTAGHPQARSTSFATPQFQLLRRAVRDSPAILTPMLKVCSGGGGSRRTLQRSYSLLLLLSTVVGAGPQQPAAHPVCVLTHPLLLLSYRSWAATTRSSSSSSMTTRGTSTGCCRSFSERGRW